jgi:hypothetical protein
MSVGFGGSEVDPDPAAEGLAPPSAEPDEEAVETAADVVVEVMPAAAFFVPEDFELPHPAASDTAASATVTAAPNRTPIGRLESEEFISRSMPRAAEDARGNPTTFTP